MLIQEIKTNVFQKITLIATIKKIEENVLLSGLDVFASLKQNAKGHVTKMT